MSQRGSQSAIFIGGLTPREIKSSPKKEKFLLKRDIALHYQYIDRLKKQIDSKKSFLKNETNIAEKEKIKSEIDELYKKKDLIYRDLEILHKSKKKKKKK